MHVKSIGDLSALAKKRRNTLGMNQLELSEKIGASRDWVINFEKGKATVELGLVFRVIQALDLAIHIEPAPLIVNEDSEMIDLDEIIGTTAGDQETFRPEVLLGRIYRKVDSSPKEHIRFRDGNTFLYASGGGRWKSLPYLVTNEGILLDWGGGDEFSCEILRGGKELVEHSRHGKFTWRQTSDIAYSSARGSTGK